MISLEDFYAALENNKEDYVLIQNFLSHHDHKKCLDIARNMNKSDDEDYDCIKNIDIKDLLGPDHFLSQIDTNKIAEIYGLDNVDEVSWVITKDYPEFYNTFHTDVHYRKNTVTLQWYLDIEDESRTLHVTDAGIIPFDKWNNNNEIKKLHTSSNSMVAFKATPRTYHAFKAGYGYRYNVRLRIKEYLNKEETIHHYDRNNALCWFIDAKDMEAEAHPKDDNFWYPSDGTLEEYLTKFTYDCLRANNQDNIIVSDKIKEYSKTLQYLKDQGFEKCVIVFAGAFVTEDTIDYVYNNTDSFPVYGQLDYENNKFYRKTTIINLNQVDINSAIGKGTYLSSYVENAKHVNHKKDLNCYYVHPEHDTFRALFDLSRYSNGVPYKCREIYNELNDKDKEDIITMSEHSRKNISKMFVSPKIKTINSQ